MGNAITVSPIASRVYDFFHSFVDLRKEVVGVLGFGSCLRSEFGVPGLAGRQRFRDSIFDLHIQFSDNHSYL